MTMEYTYYAQILCITQKQGKVVHITHMQSDAILSKSSNTSPYYIIIHIHLQQQTV